MSFFLKGTAPFRGFPGSLMVLVRAPNFTAVNLVVEGTKLRKLCSKERGTIYVS